MYKAVQASRLYEQIVDQIEESIRTKALKEGDQLPPERELAQQFGVSRTAVREAVKALRGKGLVEAYPGRGTFIINQNSHSLRQTLDRLANAGDSQGALDLCEVRELFEPEIAALAALRATEEHLSEIRALIKLMEDARPDPLDFLEADNNFHLALAKACSNPLIFSLADPIIGLLREHRLRARFATGTLDRAQHHHKCILEAVEHRDPAAARDAMRAHLQQVRTDCASAPAET
jgi:GntR family transcriptional regulator, transcriptional repressor for pyruvate dehydrogenase complex